MFSRRPTLVVLPALALAFACGSSSKSTPAAPTATTTSAAAGAMEIDLSVLTPSGTLGAGVQTPVVGIVAQVSGACPALTFVLSGVTVHASAATRFEGGGCTEIKEGMRAGAMGSKRADGSVDAERIKVGAPPLPAVTGLVGALTGACPALTFVLEGTTVRTSGRTVFEGGGCGDLKAGMRAGAIGPRLGDGSIDAEHVKMAAAPAPQPQPVTGVIKSLAGTCPDLRLVIDATTVHTSGKTLFEGGGCGDLKVGMRAGAIGPKRADGSIDAERMKMAPPAPPAITGTVASVSGACPDLTFVIERTTVHTSAKTVFDSCVCTDVEAGVKGGAIGPKRPDGSIDAEKVRVAK